jgi:hypothetical protein
VRWLFPLAILLSNSAFAVTSGDSGFDTSGLAGTTLNPGEDTGTAPTGSATGIDSGDEYGWSGGYSSADLAGEPGGNAWDGACSEGGKSGILLVGLLVAARRRRD